MREKTGWKNGKECVPDVFIPLMVEWGRGRRNSVSFTEQTCLLCWKGRKKMKESFATWGAEGGGKGVNFTQIIKQQNDVVCVCVWGYYVAGLYERSLRPRLHTWRGRICMLQRTGSVEWWPFKDFYLCVENV